jgi:hypothetical protein
MTLLEAEINAVLLATNPAWFAARAVGTPPIDLYVVDAFE